MNNKIIIKYLENLVLSRFTIKEFETKIKSDFNLTEFSISKNDIEALNDTDDSFIFSIELKQLLIDVTMYYIYTNKKDTFLVTEVSYEFEVL